MTIFIIKLSFSLTGHFLGVDHCGHRFDNNNIALKEKLNEINLVVENII